jgi:hypothetical protein
LSRGKCSVVFSLTARQPGQYQVFVSQAVMLLAITGFGLSFSAQAAKGFAGRM